jgi:hypothetical protein
MRASQADFWPAEAARCRGVCFFYEKGDAFLNTMSKVEWTVQSTERERGRVLSFFSSRRNWDSPNPSHEGECVIPPGSGGNHTLAGERGVGRVPIPTRDIHCGTLAIHMYFVVQSDNIQPVGC